MSRNTKKLCYAAVCLALAMVLPFLTGQIPQIGQALSPMHIPVFLCGFLCGWPWGLAVGFIAPLMRSVLFGMPAIFPGACAMAFELATYGAVSGILYKVLPKKILYIYVTLIIGMLCGRIVWGIARYVFAGLQGSSFPMSAFVAGAFTNAIPGIILHIVLIPLIVIALQRAKLVLNE
ncbi:MAG: ECF transporter S component [Oscillospiraceae bacterium]|nr:ECF transporter S component [Oscillospiraceae bacterium]